MAAPPPSAAVSGLMQRLAKCFVDVHHLPEVRRARSTAPPASANHSLLELHLQSSPGVRRGGRRSGEEKGKGCLAPPSAIASIPWAYLGIGAGVLVVMLWIACKVYSKRQARRVEDAAMFGIK